VNFVEIEAMSGRVWQPGCGPSVVEVFLSGTEPRESCGGFFEGSYTMGQFEEPPMITEDMAASMVEGMELGEPQMIHDPDSAEISSDEEEDTVVDLVQVPAPVPPPVIRREARPIPPPPPPPEIPPPPPPPNRDTLPLRAPL
jgi:hypothetical protein